MTIEENILLILVGFAFVYLVVYRKNHMLGNMGYIGLGLSIYLLENTTAVNALGLIVMFGAIASLIYDVTSKFSKKNLA